MPFRGVLMIGIFRKFREIRGTAMSTEVLIKADIEAEVLQDAMDLIHYIESLLSAYRNDSYICKINNYAGISPVKCPPLVVEVVEKALSIAELTNGYFDPTVGSLTHGLYGFGTSEEKLPSEDEVSRAKELVNYKNVRVSGNTIFLEKEGMRLDLGGVAKGWTAQKVAEFLINMGATKVMVNIGGEICTYGKNWRIAVKKDSGENYLGIIETIRDKTTISTSGRYERFIADVNKHHILNPKKGSQENYYSSITLVGKGFCGAELDALATACFNMEIENLYKLTQNYIILTDIGDLMVGKGLNGVVKGIYLMMD